MCIRDSLPCVEEERFAVDGRERDQCVAHDVPLSRRVDAVDHGIVIVGRVDLPTGPGSADSQVGGRRPEVPMGQVPCDPVEPWQGRTRLGGERASLSEGSGEHLGENGTAARIGDI